MTAARWVYGYDDQRSHLLADDAPGVLSGVSSVVTKCRARLSSAPPVYSVPPSLDVCAACTRPSIGVRRVDPPPPQFPAAPPP